MYEGEISVPIWKQFESQFEQHKTFLILFSLFMFGSIIGRLFFAIEPYNPLFDQTEYQGPKDRKFIQKNILAILRKYTNREYMVQKLDNISPRDFQKYVKNNQPLLMTGLTKNWKAMQWKDEYLNEKIGGVQASIKTSKGNKFDKDSKIILMTVNDFFEKYFEPKRKTNYLLSDGDMKFFSTLEKDFPKRPNFIPPYWKHEKTYLWIDSSSQTPLNNPGLETLICQIKGSFTILLFDPFQTDLLYLNQDSPNYSNVDPINPDLEKYPLFMKAVPLKVTLKEGEILYIPFGWFYMITSREGKNYAIQYFYSGDSELNNLMIATLTSPFWKDPYNEKAKKVMNRKTKWLIRNK